MYCIVRILVYSLGWSHTLNLIFIQNACYISESDLKSKQLHQSVTVNQYFQTYYGTTHESTSTVMNVVQTDNRTYSSVTQLNQDASMTFYEDFKESDHIFYRLWLELMNNISAVSILDHLLSNCLITTPEYAEIVKPVNSEFDKTALILGYVAKKGNSALVKFVKALTETGHEHVVTMIIKKLKELKRDHDVDLILQDATDKNMAL